MFENELEAAVTIAREAGKLVLEHYAREIIAEEKLGADNFYEPVTAADRDASSLIVKHLAAVFPDDAILSEEADDDTANRLSKKRSWIIDPIDGTAGFVKKDGDFSVQIGLAIDGEAVAGVVFMPFHDILYSASKGGGSYAFHGTDTPVRLAVSQKTDFARMKLALTRNHYSEKMARIIEAFHFAATVRRGSVGLKIGLIAEQICDIYIHPSPRTKLWDTCSPQIILEEAGGKLTDLFGSPLKYDIADVQNHNGILATNGLSHDRAVEHLRPVLNQLGRRRK
ncbi:MAG: 3'(2'),5'-bisphosphate nucleotidase CysQ family protein [Candidatus Binatia bacterium]